MVLNSKFIQFQLNSLNSLQSNFKNYDFSLSFQYLPQLSQLFLISQEYKCFKLTILRILKFNIISERYMNRLALLSSVIASNNLPELTRLQLIKHQGLATIWLNSPKDLNCLSTTMVHQIRQTLYHLDNDPSTKVIVIRSRHNKVFCAGADIKHMKENDYSVYPHNVRFLDFQRAFKNSRKPIISVVEGKALGGGFELAFLTDIIIASSTASFGLPEITLGLIPGIGGTQFLTRTVGTKKAMKMILTGETISAEEAGRLNIAHFIPQANFEADLNKIIDSLLNKASGSMEAAKRSIKFAWETTLDQGLEHEASIFQGLFNKEGPLQGLTAFLEKRKPNFRTI